IEDFRNGFVFDGNKNTLPPSAHYAKHNVGGVNRMVDGGRENPLNKNLSFRAFIKLTLINFSFMFREQRNISLQCCQR
ncbi:MAG: hypothetical protein IJD59_03145, partial [Clostridia bacterium]|nr:hypothetical protein [Clostridia bacterium]